MRTVKKVWKVEHWNGNLVPDPQSRSTRVHYDKAKAVQDASELARRYRGHGYAVLELVDYAEVGLDNA